MKLDLGVVPGAQQPTGISNWIQDEVIKMMNKAHPGGQVDWCQGDWCVLHRKLGFKKRLFKKPLAGRS